MSMIIAIDYDGTFTRAPDMWARFMQDAISRGCRVICATKRHDNEEERITHEAFNEVEIHYSGRKAKAKHLMDMGINVNIWIDDDPAGLYSSG